MEVECRIPYTLNSGRVQEPSVWPRVNLSIV